MELTHAGPEDAAREAELSAPSGVVCSDLVSPFCHPDFHHDGPNHSRNSHSDEEESPNSTDPSVQAASIWSGKLCNGIVDI